MEGVLKVLIIGGTVALAMFFAYLSAACGNALPGWPCDKEWWRRWTEPGGFRGAPPAGG